MITAKKTIKTDQHEYLILVHDWLFYTIRQDGEFLRQAQITKELHKIAMRAIEEAIERRDEIQATGPQWVQL
jgi:hypothetical protein